MSRVSYLTRPDVRQHFFFDRASAAWKHRNLSHVAQEELAPMPEDRGAEQGDVDGPLECSLALGMVAAEARGSIAARQAAESANFQLGGPEKLTIAHDIRHALQKNGGLADQWYMDDGDIVCPAFPARFRCRQRQSRSGVELTENRSHLLRERPRCSTS